MVYSSIRWCWAVYSFCFRQTITRTSPVPSSKLICMCLTCTQKFLTAPTSFTMWSSWLSFRMNRSQSHTVEWIIFTITGISVCSPLFKLPFTADVLDGFLLLMNGLSLTTWSPFSSIFFRTWTNVRITFCSRRAQRLSLINVRFIIDSLVGFSARFFLTWCDKRSCQAQMHPSNRGRWFHVWRLFVGQAHCYDNQWNLALMEAGVVSKMQTPAIPFLFPKKWLFSFFILEKQLSSQNIFLIKSKLSITTYLFLVF